MQPIYTHGKFFDMTGMEFGRLRVMSRAVNARNGNAQWRCQCQCGAIIVANGQNIRIGHTASCGCLQRQRAGDANATHGATRGGATPEYRIWVGIKTRCENQKSTSYRWYGARGIKICDRWAKSFEMFLCDMGKRPSTKHSIERKHADGDYCPENCKWATSAEQAANSRRNLRIEFNGRSQIEAHWCRELGLARGGVSRRLRNGWTLEIALTSPVDTRRNIRWQGRGIN